MEKMKYWWLFPVLLLGFLVRKAGFETQDEKTRFSLYEPDEYQHQQLAKLQLATLSSEMYAEDAVPKSHFNARGFGSHLGLLLWFKSAVKAPSNRQIIMTGRHLSTFFSICLIVLVFLFCHAAFDFPTAIFSSFLLAVLGGVRWGKVWASFSTVTSGTIVVFILLLALEIGARWAVDTPFIRRLGFIMPAFCILAGYQLAFWWQQKRFQTLIFGVLLYNRQSLMEKMKHTFTIVITALIDAKLITSASLSSNEPISFNACLALSKSIKTNTFCFEHSNNMVGIDPILDTALFLNAIR